MTETERQGSTSSASEFPSTVVLLGSEGSQIIR